MRLKLFHLLSACVATVGLLTSPAIASSYGIKSQEKLIESELLKVEKGNIQGNYTQKNQNKQKLENLQSFSVANYSHTSQSYQADLASILNKNPGFILLLFITYALISFIILAVWYQNYQNQLDNQEAENEQSFIEREKQIETLERIWRMEV
jgi:hypothetical protein